MGDLLCGLREAPGRAFGVLSGRLHLSDLSGSLLPPAWHGCQGQGSGPGPRSPPLSAPTCDLLLWILSLELVERRNKREEEEGERETPGPYAHQQSLGDGQEVGPGAGSLGKAGRVTLRVTFRGCPFPLGGYFWESSLCSSRH